MLRSVFCLTILLMSLLGLSSKSTYIQEQGMTRFAIHQVVSAEIEGEPQIHKVRGMATISSGIKQEDVSILIYTKSGGGGNIQLQMLGSGHEREPNIAYWQDNGEWETEIWLGKKEPTPETFYWVYAVAIQNFNTATDGGRLITSTNDRYRNFEGEVLDVLKQGNFKLLKWEQIRASVKRGKQTKPPQ